MWLPKQDLNMTTPTDMPILKGEMSWVSALSEEL